MIIAKSRKELDKMRASGLLVGQVLEELRRGKHGGEARVALEAELAGGDDRGTEPECRREVGAERGCIEAR